ncbi:MAG: hypothetical protein KDA90_00035 [Planctomycetaceae bacterium]|nr:hypothetical protein [Planctomycetaceae bacterium]
MTIRNLATRRTIAAVFLLWGAANAAIPARAEQRFEVRYADAEQRTYTGRVYLFCGQGPREPRSGPNWFDPDPMFAIDVVDWKPGEILTFSASTPGLMAFPKPLDELDLRGWKVQAVARFNPWERKVGTGERNGFSDVVSIPADGSDQSVQLTIQHRVPSPEFVETNDVRLLRLQSNLLSQFHQRDVSIQGGVRLPPSYHQQPDRRYPVIFEIPGFGGTHAGVRAWSPQRQRSEDGVEFIVVVLDPSCPLGHHVFADSANNGPWGTALVQEFIPELDRQFRTDARPAARFLSGHSSGGWSSLWLQVTHPDDFGGTWSTAPDPVDFHDFQQIDLYAGQNMYVDPQGARRPLARLGGRVAAWYDQFCQMEDLMGYGGQLHSFEAVFSPADAMRPIRIGTINAPPAPSPQPKLLWNRDTGVIDPQVAAAWKKYDIRHQLVSRWPELGPRLQGKLTVIMGEQDTFYLEGATRRLKVALEELGSDARIELVPDRDHFDLLTPELRQRIINEMAASYRKNLP